MQKIIPNLWFNTEAEEAVKLYASLFPNSSIGRITRYDAASAAVSGQKEGTVLTIECTLNGQEFLAMNGGPLFKFSEAVSFIINCENQEEIDRYWNALTADGGEESQCGWCKDKFGLSWQVTPTALPTMLMDSDKEKAGRTMQAMLAMKKLDIAALEAAFNGI
jgi:predicted 3-demethylubiquinone-9 3-methyltransferase (glyoxalase superfamily)